MASSDRIEVAEAPIRQSQINVIGLLADLARQEGGWSHRIFDNIRPSSDFSGVLSKHQGGLTGPTEVSSFKGQSVIIGWSSANPPSTIANHSFLSRSFGRLIWSYNCVAEVGYGIVDAVKV